MSADTTPADDLRHMRQLIVAKRRELAIAAIKNPKRLGDLRAQITVMQEGLDAIDRAIGDENRLAQGQIGPA
jgi:hypothetical protein